LLSHQSPFAPSFSSSSSFLPTSFRILFFGYLFPLFFNECHWLPISKYLPPPLPSLYSCTIFPAAIKDQDVQGGGNCAGGCEGGM
jgi:hypothetical protein